MKIAIKEQMEKKNMTRYQLAQIVGVTYPTITAIYQGTTSSIKLDILEKICLALECSPNDILIFELPS